MGQTISFFKRAPALLIHPILLAGVPAIKANAGTSFVTTAPAAIKQYLPKLLPHIIVALAPIDAPFLTIVLRYSSFLAISDRGLLTFVKTQEGPQKTSFSNSTPS